MFDMVVRDGIWYESVERRWKSDSDLGLLMMCLRVDGVVWDLSWMRRGFRRWWEFLLVEVGLS